MIQTLHTFLQLLLPNYCLLCLDPTRSSLALCEDCIEGLPWQSDNCCDRCARPLSQPGRCGNCLKAPPAFDRVRAPFYYAPPLDQFINRLKFNHNLLYASLLGTLVVRQLRQHQAPLPELILPVPLHRHRLRSRGFNQAGELAKIIAKQTRLPCRQTLLKRIRATKAQAQLNAKARAANVHNAFALTKPLPVKSIALIDDVLTTGETAKQLCHLLKLNGATTVEVWTVARAYRA